MKLDHNVFAKMLIDFLRPMPTKIIHNNEHTIILFDDGSKTVTKPNGDKYDPYIGFCVAMTAKYFGGKKAAHQAYESLSGCKFHKQPEQLATLDEAIKNATENMNRLAEAFKQERDCKQTEPKANPLPILQSGGRYCSSCRHFNVLFYEEPCKSCKKKANDDSRYPNWQAPLQTSNEQVLAVDEKEGETLWETKKLCKRCIFKWEDDFAYCSYFLHLTEAPIINCKYFRKKEGN